MTKKFLADVVDHFRKRSGLSYAQIARKADLANKTVISNWVNGYSKRPRLWHDLVRFARALELTEDEANEVLVAGGHELVGALRTKAKSTDEKELLSYWEVQPHIIYQAPRMDVREFVGRRDEQDRIRQALLENQKICALVGMGGIGKSTLAQKMARQLRNHFPDGVLWARVNGEASLMEILRSFAATYGRDVKGYSDRDSRSAIVRELLANKKALIVLDNIENSVELNTLLPPAGTCAVLVTTRNRQTVRSLPATRIELAPLANEESLELLSSYLGEERVATEIEGAIALVDFVERLPLALRVIASTLKETDYLTLQEYAEMLADRQERLAYLEDWEDATKNVRAVFAETYDQLDAGSQRLFSKLAVFEGLEFSVAAVAAVAQIPLPQAKLRMGRLASLSLVNETAVSDHYVPQSRQEQEITRRYHCHALLQLFAQEQLGETLGEVRSRAADYYANFAHQFGTNHRYQWLDLEWPNIAAALSWAHHQAMPETLQRGVEGVTQVYLGVVGYLEARGHWQDAHEILQWVQQTAEKESFLEATTLFKLGAFSFRLAQYEQARAYLQASKKIADKLPASSETAWLRAYMSEFMSRLEMEQDGEDALTWLESGLAALQTIDTVAARHHQGYLQLIKSEVLARMMGLLEKAAEAAESGLALLPEEPTSAHLTAFINLSVIYAYMGDLGQSDRYLSEGIPIAEKLGNAPRLATMLMNRGVNRQKAGQLDEAKADSEKAQEIFARIGDADQEGSALVNLGMIYTIWGEDEVAVDCLQRAIGLATKHNIPNLEAYAKTTLIRPFLRQGKQAAAAATTAEALALCRQYRYPDLTAVALFWQGWLHHEQGETENGLKLVQQAIGLVDNGRFPQEAGMAHSFRGQMLDGKRAFDNAEAAHRQALKLLAEQDRYELTLAQLAWGQHHLSQTSAPPQEIIDLLAAARASFVELGAMGETAVVDELLARSIK